ncbi:uncharacterized protein LOC119738068 [Patiria miniata]|uniref:Domain of unknown function with conserved HDNR motif domain-containing protein n=1 Tax=Patiria miniata TaxID=46514 RepID=A0A914AZN5_PATMI|nr:uncharacterized protein LOC119738068 [Patiria miniata]
MAKTTHISSQGSWFPTGYYGHFRSKSRNDFVNDYRQQAKPSPPEKFCRKLQTRPTAHQFSHHDNRFSFLNTVTSFQDGLGKKKVTHARTSKFRPDFISWVPHAKEIKDGGPVVSVYRETFRNSETNRVPQILVPAVAKPTKYLSASAPAFLPTPYTDPPDMVQDKPITTYQFTHRHQQPNPWVHTNMNTGSIEENPVPVQKSNTYINPRIESIYNRPKQQISMTRLRRSRTGSAPIFRTSVADCLNWHRPEAETTELNFEKPRPKTATGVFPEVNGAETNSANHRQPSPPLQPRPPQMTVKGTVCQSTAWGTEGRPELNQSSTVNMNTSVDTKPLGNGPTMAASNSITQSTAPVEAMAE